MKADYKLIIAALAGLLVGSGLVGYVYEEYGGFGQAAQRWGLFSSARSTTTQSGQSLLNDAARSGGALSPRGNLATFPVLSVSAQKAGESVVLDSVELTEVGWVVIHEDRGGAPGNALGAARFEAGVHTGVAVPLLRATVPGGLYYAIIHSDDGDRIFDIKKDLPLADSAGAAVRATFTTP